MRCISAILCIALLWIADACNYKPKDGNQHTLCAYTGIGQACVRNVRASISANDRRDILNAHNEIRQKVASGKENGYPGSRQTYELKWDDELASIAQRWAIQCTMAHDKNRDVEYNGEVVSVGQNLGQHNVNGKMNYRFAVDRWYSSELKDFDPSYVDSYVFNSAYGHLSQVIWGNTKKIGCGISHYTDSQGPVYLMVCNYAQSGNYESEPVYTRASSNNEIGDMCEAMSGSYNSLCAPSDNIGSSSGGSGNPSTGGNPDDGENSIPSGGDNIDDSGSDSGDFQTQQPPRRVSRRPAVSSRNGGWTNSDFGGFVNRPPSRNDFGSFDNENDDRNLYNARRPSGNSPQPREKYDPSDSIDEDNYEPNRRIDRSQSRRRLDSSRNFDEDNNSNRRRRPTQSRNIRRRRRPINRNYRRNQYNERN